MSHCEDLPPFFIVSLSPLCKPGRVKEEGGSEKWWWGLQVWSKLPMLIYSDMSPHRATNPLGFLRDQIALLSVGGGKRGELEVGKEEKTGSECWGAGGDRFVLSKL